MAIVTLIAQDITFTRWQRKIEKKQGIENEQFRTLRIGCEYTWDENIYVTLLSMKNTTFSLMDQFKHRHYYIRHSKHSIWFYAECIYLGQRCCTKWFPFSIQKKDNLYSTHGLDTISYDSGVYLFIYFCLYAVDTENKYIFHKFKHRE